MVLFLSYVNQTSEPSQVPDQMEVSSVIANITSIQAALQVLQTLHFTSYLYYNEAKVPDKSSYDFIIVGGGSAGCVVTRRLVDTGKFKVLLIEAGGDPTFEVETPATVMYLPKSRADWNYNSQNDGFVGQYHINKTFQITRGKMLGGSSGINYMAHVQGSSHDFDSWAELVKDSSWSYEQIQKYFIKSERMEDEEILASPFGLAHGTKGLIGLTRQLHEVSQKYLKAFAEMGNEVVLDVNANSSLGFAEPTLAISSGERQHTAKTYISPIKSSKNLHILKNTLVTKINFNGKEAIGVQILKEGKFKDIYASKEVILSAGALNTPQLLMLSGVGPKDHLEELNITVIADLPVGQNMQDHLGVLLVHKMEPSDEPIKPEPPSQFPVPSVFGFSTINPDQDYPDYMTENFIILHDSPASVALCSFFLGFTDKICQTVANAGVGRELLLTVLGLLHPASRGKVLLKSTDPEDPPLIYPGYFSNVADLDKMTEYVIDFLKVENSSYFKESAEFIHYDIPECSNFMRGTKYYWRCYSFYLISSMYRFSCTCAMGSVVNSALRVYDLQNVRVVDASVMPTIPGANTNANIIMVAEKAADMIIGDYEYGH